MPQIPRANVSVGNTNRI